MVLAVALVISLGFQMIKTETKQPEMVQDSLSSQEPATQAQGMHQMPDGSMMANSNSGMDMGAMMMNMTANLQGKTGAELEQVFLRDMIVHHQGAVDMSRELLKGNPRPELAKFANDIIDLQTKEINMQKTWLAEWYQAAK